MPYQTRKTQNFLELFRGDSSPNSLIRFVTSQSTPLHKEARNDTSFSHFLHRVFPLLKVQESIPNSLGKNPPESRRTIDQTTTVRNAKFRSFIEISPCLWNWNKTRPLLRRHESKQEFLGRSLLRCQPEIHRYHPGKCWRGKLSCPSLGKGLLSSKFV